MNFDLVTLFKSDDFQIEKVKSEILDTNVKSAEYGLILSEQEAEMIVRADIDALSEQERINFGESMVQKMIEKFMQSSYIAPSEYAETIAELIDIFYEVKEESYDILTDDEIIDVMYSFFEHKSGGSLEVLRNRDMEEICRSIRNKANRINYI